jgi:hypothetical protein
VNRSDAAVAASPRRRRPAVRLTHVTPSDLLGTDHLEAVGALSALLSVLDPEPQAAETTPGTQRVLAELSAPQTMMAPAVLRRAA